MGSAEGLLCAIRCNPSHSISLDRKSSKTAVFLAMLWNEKGRVQNRLWIWMPWVRIPSLAPIFEILGVRMGVGAVFVTRGLLSPKILLRSATLGCFRKLSRGHVSCFQPTAPNVERAQAVAWTEKDRAEISDARDKHDRRPRGQVEVV